MVDAQAEYRNILKTELERRVIKNPRYSLRAFANHLEIDPAVVSKILAGKFIPTAEMAAEMAFKLKLEGEVRKRFIISAAEEKMCHTLYLIDPSLTECDPTQDAVNVLPSKRKK